MSFFYDLNKKLDSIRATPEVTHQQLNERDMKKTGKLEEEGFPRIQAAIQKYTQPGVNKLAKLGREGASKAKMAATRKEFNQYDNEEVKEESGEWSKIPVGVIDGPGGYDGAQQRIKDYESGNINRDGKKLPPVVDRSRPADKPTVYDYKGQPEEYSSPPRWERGYRPPVVDRSRPANTDESAGPAPAKPKSMVDKQIDKAKTPPPYRPSKSAPKGDSLGTIKGGVWTADPPKPGEKGVPLPMDPEGVKEGSKKLNFADKIANAKKEVDEMLGDVAAEAMRSALSPKQQKMAALGGDPERIDARDLAALRKGADMGENNAFDYKTPRSMNKGEKKTSSTGGEIYQKDNKTVVHTAGRHYGGGDEPDPKREKQSRSGAPKKSDKPRQERMTANSRKTDRTAHGQAGFAKEKKIKEGEVDIRDQGEYDQEGDMAKDDIKTIVRHAQALSKVLGDNDNLPEWVQSKLAKIEGMMISIDEYMQNQAGDEEAIAEEPKSKNQAVAARIARGVQKGTAKAKPGSASAEMAKMQPKELNKFAKGSTKGLPKTVSKKKKEVDEADENSQTTGAGQTSSEEGRLTTVRTGPGQTHTTSSTGRISATMHQGKVTVNPGKPMNKDAETSSSKSNSMVGKGIYDSMNRELELMIAESMSVNMSDSTEGNKSLTVTATDEDAMKLAMILKSAGLGGHGGDMHSHGEEACDTCGMQDCGCGDVQEAVDENAPDWPTNTETSSDALQYAGGLNKPKTDVAGDGQSTVPVVATRPHNDDDLQRIREMAGIKIKNNLGPISPAVARMSKAEVDAGLRSMLSPDNAAMSSDEVNAAFRSGMSPDISDMNPDSANAEFGKDSIQRMKEMAGIKEAENNLADKDYDGDGNIESGKDEHAGSVDKAIKKAQAEKKVDESIFALTNQWKAYKG